MFFEHGNQKIHLNPALTKELWASSSNGIVVLRAPVMSMGLVRMKTLVHEAQESQVVYALMVREAPMSHSSQLLKCRKKLLTLVMSLGTLPRLTYWPVFLPTMIFVMSLTSSRESHLPTSHTITWTLWSILNSRDKWMTCCLWDSSARV